MLPGTDGNASKSSESKTSPDASEDTESHDVGRSSGGVAGMGVSIDGERGGSETSRCASCSDPVIYEFASNEVRISGHTFYDDMILALASEQPRTCAANAFLRAFP